MLAARAASASASGQDFLDVSDASGTGGYHRDGKFLSKMGICLHGIAVLGAVIIH